MKYGNALSFGQFMKGIFTVLALVFFLLAPELYKKSQKGESTSLKKSGTEININV